MNSTIRAGTNIHRRRWCSAHPTRIARKKKKKVKKLNKENQIAHSATQHLLQTLHLLIFRNTTLLLV